LKGIGLLLGLRIPDIAFLSHFGQTNLVGLLKSKLLPEKWHVKRIVIYILRYYWYDQLRSWILSDFNLIPLNLNL